MKKIVVTILILLMIAASALLYFFFLYRTDEEKRAEKTKKAYYELQDDISIGDYDKALKKIDVVCKNVVLKIKKKSKRINTENQLNYYIKSLYLKGDIYKAQNKTDDANDAYKIALKKDLEMRKDIESMTATDYLKRAIEQVAEGDLDGAYKSIEAGLKKKSVACKRELLYNKIVILENQLKWEEAKQAMTEYKKEYPGDNALEKDDIFLTTR